MKKLLILQMRPEVETADSEFEAFLRVGKINRDKVDRIRLDQSEKVDLDLNKYFAIIAGGSPFDVSCPDEKKGKVQKRIESFFNQLFNQIIDLDFPFLGACSGNGLLGKYCGSPITNKYSEPVGSVIVHLTENGFKDDLLQGLPESFTAFVGHKEACESVPNNAKLLLTSDTCPVQMFRVRNNIYATQFHPEADVEEFHLRINIYKNYGYFPPEKAQELISGINGTEAPHTQEILRRFIDKYQSN